MKLMIDRMEGAFAVVELPDGKTEQLPAALLPEGAQEGDVLELRLLPEERKAREERIKSLMDKVFE